MASRGWAVGSLGLALALAAAPGARAEPHGGWAGPYAGLYAGYAFGRATASEPTDPRLGFPFYNGADTPYRFDVAGAAVGGTAGYNFQWGRTVAGVELELGYLGLSGSEIDPNGTIVFGTPDTTTTVKSDFHAALVGRIGAAMGRTLLYLKAGGTLLNARASTIDPCVQPPASCGTGTLTMHGSAVMFGWTAGGGVEWAIDPRWTARLDYAYSDFGSIATSGPSNVAGEFYKQHVDVTAHTVKLGVNYRFAGFAR